MRQNDLAGAEDFRREDEQYVVTTEPAQLHAVKVALDEKGMSATEAEIAWIPKNTVRIEGKAAETLIKLLEGLSK